MQAKIVTENQFRKIDPYTDLMHAGGRPAKHPRSELGARIAEARKRKGMSQTALAEALGVTQQVVAAWERKSTGVRSDTLCRIASVLDVSSDELLGLQQGKHSGPGGRVRRTMECVSNLPRRQQDKILDVVDAFVEKTVNETE